jgi:hypothetical protein
MLRFWMRRPRRHQHRAVHLQVLGPCVSSSHPPHLVSEQVSMHDTGQVAMHVAPHVLQVWRQVFAHVRMQLSSHVAPQTVWTVCSRCATTVPPASSPGMVANESTVSDSIASVSLPIGAPVIDVREEAAGGAPMG